MALICQPLSVKSREMRFGEFQPRMTESLLKDVLTAVMMKPCQ